MPYYRLYHLDPHSGHINRAEEMFAADDAAAMAVLRERCRDHPLELWDGGRKLGRVDPAPDAAARSPTDGPG